MPQIVRRRPSSAPRRAAVQLFRETVAVHGAAIERLEGRVNAMRREPEQLDRSIESLGALWAWVVEWSDAGGMNDPASAADVPPRDRPPWVEIVDGPGDRLWPSARRVVQYETGCTPLRW
jgi:hypothetical protein